MILIYTDEITPRFRYTVRLLFSTILGVNFKISDNVSEFLNSVLPKINYSPKKFKDEIYIKPHGLLTKKEVEKVETTTVIFNGETCFFPVSGQSAFPFDLFAMSFYIVTRFEEYLEDERDKFGRYPAVKSVLYQTNLLKKPVVNILADMLAAEISRKYPDTVFPEKKFSFISTIDIDNAWAVLNKGFWRTGGALINSAAKGTFAELNSRINILRGKENDPFDTYNYLDSVFRGNEDKVKFFFLLGDYSVYDKNVSYRNLNFRKLIRQIADKYDIGIHPSFAGYKNGSSEKVVTEKKRLEEITNKTVNKSRQHYLNLELPKTLQNLIRAGIKEDYTLGYPSQTGFRAGICTPFYFYDLQHETETNLLLIPFQVMDGTLRNYLNYLPEEAWVETEKIMTEVKKVGGTFVGIWHNETVNDRGDWKGYRQVFEEMNRLGFQWANE